MPAGCSGTVANPGAARGNLCEFTNEAVGAVAGLCDWQDDTCYDRAGTAGSYVMVSKTSFQLMEVNGSWAVTAR